MNFLNLSIKRVALLFGILVWTISWSQAQFVIQYPVTANGITTCLNASSLTIRIDVNVLKSDNDSIFVNFPPGIAYVPGSVIKIGGSEAVNISEAGGTPESPKFVLSPATLVAGQNITFSIERRADCMAREAILSGTIFKDAVTVKGSSGSVVENDPAINAYNVNYPSLSFTQPVTVAEASLGSSYTRNFSVTNGSEGCADHLYFYMVYPDGGLEFSSLTLNGNAISPSSINGDTLFFSVSGALLTDDGLLCNGESLLFSETFKVKKCESKLTHYQVGWGCDALPGNWCQSAQGVGNISFSTGVPSFTNITRTNINFVNKCTPFDYSLSLYNGGTGDVKSSAMYDLTLMQGETGSMISLDPLNASLYTVSNVRIGTTSVPFNIENGILKVQLKDLFTSDPDGDGGITDVDEDGFYDDLPGGQSVELIATLAFNCSLECNQDKYFLGFSATMQYHTMCDNTIITAGILDPDLPGSANYELLELQFFGNGYLPVQISGDDSFRLNLKAGYYSNVSIYDGENTRYRWTVELPSGVSVAGTGNATYGSSPVTSFTQVGNTITYTSNENLLSTFSLDLAYDCNDGGGIKQFDYTLEKIQDITTNCKCQGDLICGSLFTLASCNNNCSTGPFTYVPTVKRSDESLGWTDETLSTRQSASNISEYDLSKALYMDKMEIAGSAKQNSSTSNLYLEFQLAKTTLNPIGINKLTPIDATVTIFRGGVVVAGGTISDASQSNSTSTMQIINWDFSALLPAGGLMAGDSISTLTRYQVAVNDGLPLYDVQSGNRWAFYNEDSVGGRIECNYAIPEMYLVGTIAENGMGAIQASGCDLGEYTFNLARRFNSSGTTFPNEFRPAMKIVSLALNIPVGYQFISAKYIDYHVQDTITLVPTSVNGQLYTFTNPGSWPNMPITVTNNYGGSVKLVLRPTCATLLTEIINIKTTIQDFYYAYAGTSDPIPSPVILEGESGKYIAIRYSELSRSNLTISDQTGRIQAASPIENFVARLSSTATSLAPNTWIAIPNRQGVQITQVTDMATNSVLTPISYSNGQWYQLSSIGLGSGESADYKISFSYTTTSLDSINVLAGWNCGSFPVDPTASSCGNSSLWFKFDPVASEITINPLSVSTGDIDMCVPATYEYVMISAQAGNTINNIFSVTYPVGLLPVNDSFEAEYPLGANNWTTLIPTQSGRTYTYDLTQHPSYPSTTGLPGTIDATNSNQRAIGIRFKTITDCEFVVKSNFVLRGSATTLYGQKVLGSLIAVQGPAITINGVTETYSTINTITTSGEISCDNDAKIFIKSVIVGGTTGSSDSIRLTLPYGLELVANSLNCTSAACPVFGNSMIQSNNETILTYIIPSGLSAGSVMEFSIDVRDVSSASCGEYVIALQTEEVVPGIGCSTAPNGICAAISVITGSATTTLNVKRPTVLFNSLTGSVTQDLLDGSGDYALSFEIENSGTADLTISNPLTIDFYCADATGKPTGNALATYINPISLPMGEFISATTSFNAIGCNNSTNLVAVIAKNNNCLCEETMQTFQVTTIAVNSPPDAMADYFEVPMDHSLNGSLLDNDTDLNDDILTLELEPVVPPLHGSLILYPNGTFTYQPDIDFLGNDSFIYRICDNGTPSLCDTAIVKITVVKDVDCVVHVVNSFSPNGDGINDLFKIKCLYNYENPVFEVYNRWGNRVFKKDHYGNLDYWGSEAEAWWNGRSDHKWTVGSTILPGGTYYYVLKLDSEKILTGFLFLSN